MEFISHGLPLSYDDQGPREALPIVFVHGFPFSREMWAPQIAAFKNSYRIITFDNRGHGQSAVGDGQYPLEFYVDDLIALLDHLHLPKAVVCGLSMGGYIVLRALERSPDRFRAAVLCDTRSDADSNEAKIKRAEGIRSVKEKGVAAYAEGFLKAVFAPESFQTQPGKIEFIRKIIQATSALGICGALLALAGRTDTTDSLERLRLPVLIMVGEKDGITPTAAAQAMQQHIPGSRLEIIPAAGHMSNLENPDRFNQHFESFIASL